MTTALVKAKKKLRSRPIHGTIRRVIVIGNDGKPETGELLGAFVPEHPVDRKAMKENRYTVGRELKAVFKQSRNPGFWRKAHLVGGWLAENHVPEFDGLAQHAAVKRMQELSGVGCESVTYDLGKLGKITRNEALSLNFDEMDQTEFDTLWDGGEATAYAGGWIGWLRENVFPQLPVEMAEQLESLIKKKDQPA